MDLMELDDTKDLVRDVHSKALLTVNNSKLREHQSKRDAARMVMKNAEDISVLKDEMSEIKNMLKILINKDINKTQ
jgi:hypothetical protein